ncbi:Initiator RepB protein [Sulfitobacter geojensis]|nr:Initiator RepB protein [Sulfitobacter geojensis]
MLIFKPQNICDRTLRRGSVKKHVAAIHVSGKLTLLQRKLSNVLLLNAYDTLTTGQAHMIDARTLCLMIGYNSNDMDTLKASLRGLARRWIAQHGEDHVAEKIAYVGQQRNVKNPVGYLSAALKDGFTTETKPAAPSSSRAKDLERIRDLVASRTPTQRDADRRLFMSQIESADARADFERHGWMSALNTISIKAFWQEMVPDAFEET